MDDWNRLKEDLRGILTDLPRELLPIITDYVRSRRHAWTAVARQPPNVRGHQDWRIDNNIAEAVGGSSVYGIRSLYCLADGPSAWTVSVSSRPNGNVRIRASIGVINSSDSSDGEDRGNSYLLSIERPSATVIYGDLLFPADFQSEDVDFQIRLVADPALQTIVATFNDSAKQNIVVDLHVHSPREFGWLRPFVRLYEGGSVSIQ